MKKFLLLLFFIPIFSFSQKLEKIKGNKNVTIKETKIDSFTRISIGEKFKINLLEGKPKVKIETDDNLHDVIEFEVSNGKLSFAATRRITSSKEMNITVYYPRSLTTIEAKEDAELKSLSTIELDSLNLITRGRSKVDLEIETTAFNFTNSRKSKVDLDVDTEKATINLKESSRLKGVIKAPEVTFTMIEKADSDANIEADDLILNVSDRASFSSKSLISKDCKVTSSGNARASVNVSKKITISAKDDSTINIYNNPEFIIEKFTDSASLNKK